MTRRLTERQELPALVGWEVAAELQAIPAARNAVVQAVGDWGLPLDRDVLADVKLCASEIIANAVIYTGAPCTVSVGWNGKRLRVEVADASLRLPRLGNETNRETHGRGLTLVAALARDMGWYPHGAGKVVWFEFGTHSGINADQRLSAPVPAAHECGAHRTLPADFPTRKGPPGQPSRDGQELAGRRSHTAGAWLAAPTSSASTELQGVDMTRSVDPSTTQVRPETSASTTSDGFDLDVALLEVSDAAGLTNLTDDNCGTTCGACTTNVA